MGTPIISAYTSVNKDKVPALFTLAAKAGLIKPGCAVLDYGCGRWPEVAMGFLESQGAALVHSFDPAWFPDADRMLFEGYDLVCLSNVLNVIEKEIDRLYALKDAWDSLKPGGRLLVTVYEADASGASGPSRDGCWQERRKLESYAGRELACYLGEILPGTGGKLWASMPKPARGEKWYPPIGTKLTLHYLTGSETPFTVVRIEKGRVIIRRCELIYDGPRTYEAVADRIVPGGPDASEEELTWHQKIQDWHGKGRYGGWVAWGVWTHQPYTD